MELNPINFNDIWPYVLSILTLIVLPFLISGDKPIGAVKIIAWLKERLKIQDGAARVLTFMVGIFLAILVSLVDGSIGLTGPMTPERFTIILTVLVGSSQYWYARLQEPA